MTRLNISELYQYLNAESILQQMVDRQLILPTNKENAVAYSHKYAQNCVATSALFSTLSGPPTFLLSLCDVLEATGNTQHQNLAAILRSGILIEESHKNHNGITPSLVWGIIQILHLCVGYTLVSCMRYYSSADFLPCLDAHLKVLSSASGVNCKFEVFTTTVNRPSLFCFQESCTGAHHLP